MKTAEVNPAIVVRPWVHYDFGCVDGVGMEMVEQHAVNDSGGEVFYFSFVDLGEEGVH